MSHFSRIKTQIVEKEFLLKALDDLGYRYEEGNLEIRGFGGQKIAVEIKLNLRLSYDVGFRKVGETYEIVADWYGVHGDAREKLTGPLLQRYAYHATRSKLEQQGFDLIEEKSEKGEIRLTLRRMA